MNTKQARVLMQFRMELLTRPPKKLDMRGTVYCAYDVLEKRHKIFRINNVFGINVEEQRYLFAHAGYEYSKPIGRAAAEEFADRVENILQFHKTLNASA